jgi:hypothetical protein
MKLKSLEPTQEATKRYIKLYYSLSFSKCKKVYLIRLVLKTSTTSS